MKSGEFEQYVCVGVCVCGKFTDVRISVSICFTKERQKKRYLVFEACEVGGETQIYSFTGFKSKSSYYSSINIY